MPLLLAPRDTDCNTPARRSGAHRAFRLAGAHVSVCLLVRTRALVDVNMRVSARLLPACTWMHMDALPWFEATLHAMPCGSRSPSQDTVMVVVIVGVRVSVRASSAQRNSPQS